MKKFFTTLGVVAAGFLLTVGFLRPDWLTDLSSATGDTNIPPSTQPPSGADEDQAARDRILKELPDRLTQAGWSSESAQAVVTLNLDRYTWLEQMDKEVLGREIDAYLSMAPSSAVSQLLAIHPELTGLFLMTRDRETFAGSILSLDDEDDRKAVINSFVKYTGLSDVSAWSKTIQRHGSNIAALLRICPAWPLDAAFIYPDDVPEVAEEYGKWLNEVFDRAALPSSDDEILSLITFVQVSGPNIRRRMAANADFRDSFRNQIWPTFAENVRRAAQERDSRVPWELFTDCDAVWSLLQRNDGKELFAVGGQFAADLLYGEERVVPELREKAAQLLLAGNQDLVSSAFFSDWSRDGLFIRLMLKRNLTDDLLLTGCGKLLSSDDPQKQLDQWNRMSESALVEDIGPMPDGFRTYIPGYAIYYSVKKLSQGRSVGWSDAVGVGGDVLTILTLGASYQATTAIKVGTKTAPTAAIKQKVRSEAVNDIVKLTSREIAEQAGKKEILSMTAHHVLRTLPAEMRQKLLSGLVLDVSDVIKTGFTMSQRLGMGRESFKKMTGLEAHVFMKDKGRVFVSVPAVLAGACPSAAFLNATAMNGAIDEAISSGPVRDAVTKLLHAGKTEEERSKQHLACWWAANATSGFTATK